jgi:long-chain acyl-CoA synthetase
MRIDTEGHLIYFDRLKDTFKNRGKQVSPSEISSLIYKHHSDLIAEISVIGVPAQGDSETVGEEAWAFLALKVNSLSQKEKERLAESIKAITREQLSIHKWVVRVEFLDELPKGSTHKILVRALRDLAIKLTTDKHQSKL